jgi:hypothetical protein
MKRGRKVKMECGYCGKEFDALMIKVRQGKGLFCCQDCYNSHRRENAKDPKYLNKMYQNKHRYGISETEYLDLLQIQNNSCAICSLPFDEIRTCVDHSHKTGKVRGLLCDSCNKGLGMFKDNPELLKKAILYLK